MPLTTGSRTCAPALRMSSSAGIEERLRLGIGGQGAHRFAQDANTKFLEVRHGHLARPCPLRILAQPFACVEVFGIETCHGVNHHGYVIHAASQWTGAILCKGTWNDTRAADQPLSRNHPDKTIVGRRHLQ